MIDRIDIVEECAIGIVQILAIALQCLDHPVAVVSAGHLPPTLAEHRDSVARGGGFRRVVFVLPIPHEAFI